MDDPDTSQGDNAHRRLLDAIRSGALAPGARLREAELATRLGVSRTPVREAIRQLEAEGLVTHLPRQGATVRTLDHAEIIELYEMRATLEGAAARMAARAASAVELAELAALNAAMAGAGDPSAAQAANGQFHRTLLGAARNRFLLAAVNALQRTLLLLGPTTLGEADRIAAAVAEHASLLDALAARDGLAAEAAMRAHIDAALAARIRGLRGRDPMAEAS